MVNAGELKKKGGKQPYVQHVTQKSCLTIRFRFMVLNATFNNISAISWLSVLLVEETEVPEVPGENHQPVYQLEH